MSFNGGMQFTNHGRNLQAKAQAGAALLFTRVAVGDGSLGSQSISDLTALINQIKSLDINKFKTMTGGKAVVGGKLSNQDIVTGFYWRELGLFATDPDLGEVLYCYGNAGALAEYIPSPGGAEILEKQVDIVQIIGNAANVSAIIDSSLVYVSQADFDDLVDEVATKETPTGAQAKADAAEAAANGYTDQEVGEVAGAVAAVAQAQASHEAESATDAHNATAISVADTGNHFTGTDVETVLAELFTSANDGKTAVASAIGSGEASATDSFSTLAGYITTDKGTLATNLTAKGQTSAGTEDLDALVAKVANISSSISVTAGDNPFISSNTETYNNGTTPAKRKEIKISGLQGTIRAKCQFSSLNANPCYVQVYKNGVAVGSPASTTLQRGGGNYADFSQDVTGVVPDDLIQLYQWATSGDNCSAKNFTLNTSGIGTVNL